MPAKHLRITGHVQGVFFRANAQIKAQECGVGGWIKNCEDGTVEIVAEGPEAALETFVHWCWKGPPAAEVESVKTTEIPEEGLYNFQIRK
ncbi:MAG: acylphosphatase [Candidatus Peribacteraceae bacterium]|jgi:acylphosphatase